MSGKATSMEIEEQFFPGLEQNPCILQKKEDEEKEEEVEDQTY
jgi:hypothetical protein